MIMKSMNRYNSNAGKLVGILQKKRIIISPPTKISSNLSFLCRWNFKYFFRFILEFLLLSLSLYNFLYGFHQCNAMDIFIIIQESILFPLKISSNFSILCLWNLKYNFYYYLGIIIIPPTKINSNLSCLSRICFHLHPQDDRTNTVWNWNNVLHFHLTVNPFNKPALYL